jgi:L,D-transpeptidase YbiS
MVESPRLAALARSAVRFSTFRRRTLTVLPMQIRVHVPSQTLDVLDDAGSLQRRYVISTSRFGLGFQPGSNKTPVGRFRIGEKVGDGAVPGEIFVSRKPTGECGQEGDPEDRVQTRILWLEGLDPENANTRERYIYIHGTNAESHLGTPASHGCIRMSNLDVIDLFELVEVGTEVWIEAEAIEEERPPREAQTIA